MNQSCVKSYHIAISGQKKNAKGVKNIKFVIFRKAHNLTIMAFDLEFVSIFVNTT